MFGKEFRPLNFGSVLGLSVIKKILQGYLREGIYETAYLFVGSYSSGKTTLGRLFARSILCLDRSDDMSPCNACTSCKAFLEDRHPGYMEIDAANNSGKDRIQEIKESIKFESIAQKKIILFDEAHGISDAGKDALLKQLEADDPNVIFIFCTTELEKMPDTIRSRCADFHLPEPSESLILEKLKKICEVKSIKYDLEALCTIVKVSGRHYRDAENRLKMVSILGDVTQETTNQVVSLYDTEVVEMLLSLPKDLSKAIQLMDQITTKMDIRSVYHSILRVITDSIKCLSGVSFESEHYNTLMKNLKSQYGSVLFEMLDFILAKNRMSDLIFFQSDMLILHHKFSKGGFNFKAFEPSQEDEQGVQKEKKQGSREIFDTKNMEPWRKDEMIRNYKKEQAQNIAGTKVPEKVSEKWGPEILDKTPAQLKKTKLSQKEFQKIIEGRIEEEKM